MLLTLLQEGNPGRAVTWPTLGLVWAWFRAPPTLHSYLVAGLEAWGLTCPLPIPLFRARGGFSPAREARKPNAEEFLHSLSLFGGRVTLPGVSTSIPALGILEKICWPPCRRVPCGVHSSLKPQTCSAQSSPGPSGLGCCPTSQASAVPP